jgi:hypothetical protein
VIEGDARLFFHRCRVQKHVGSPNVILAEDRRMNERMQPKGVVFLDLTDLRTLGGGL